MKNYRPRLSVDITAELQQRIREVIPWGVLNKIVVVILEDVISAIEKDPRIIGELLSRYISYFDLLENKKNEARKS